jgi:Na+:H+ antiporter, NhaA family
VARRITLDFLKTETAAGVILATAAAIAIALANSPWAESYFGFLAAPFTVQIGAFQETATVEAWVRDGLMAIFFFVVGLEIKFEALRGELSNPRRLGLPLLAAAGGVIGPALVYLSFNSGGDGAPHGWPTAITTDLAFAMAALSIAGPRLPPSLRVFLLTAAIGDLLIAVAVVAIFYTGDIDAVQLAGAGITLALMALLSRWKTAPYLFYAACFVLAWAFTLKSGVSTAAIGILAAFTVPIEPRRAGEPSPLQQFMRALHPYVAYLIVPLFAFVAAGFAFRQLSPSVLNAPGPVGMGLGLLLGKQLGVFGAAWLGIVTRLARKPTGAKWLELYGVAALCGMGFTLSLFVGGEVFSPETAVQTQVRAGVIGGSLLSLLVGAAALAFAQARRSAAT